MKKEQLDAILSQIYEKMNAYEKDFNGFFVVGAEFYMAFRDAHVRVFCQGTFTRMTSLVGFYEFTERLGNLYDALEKMNSTELQEQVLKLIDDVYAKLLTLDKESEVDE